MKKRQYTPGQTWKNRFDWKYLSGEDVNTDFSLRDRFALEMMKVYLQKEVRSNFPLFERIKLRFGKRFKTCTIYPDFDKMAHTCYCCADAMIAERELKANEGQ